MRILICDDEGIVQQAIRFMIQKSFGDEFEIESAKNGRMAIELAESFRPDIILMDIQMPGINGIEAMEEIKREHKNIIFIVLTAYDKFEYSQKAIDIGVMSYLTKPINKDVLTDTLRKAMKLVNDRREKVSKDLKVKEKLEVVVPMIESGFVYSVLLGESNDTSNLTYRESLGTPLKQAEEQGIPVISYDRLIMNSSAVTYYATFDNYLVGQKQGEYIVDALDLDNTDGPYNLEIFTGDPGDNNVNFFYGGAMEVLQPYIDSGKLVVQSGQVKKEEVATADWSTEKAQSRMEAILASNYNGKDLDVVLCSNDSTALGVENALEANYTGKWPVITGQDCDKPNVKNIVNGKQSMSVFKDTRKLAEQTVKMVDAIMDGKEAETNDNESYDNGTGIIPSYLCEPTVVTIDNYEEMLLDSGYYTEADIK